MNKTETGKALAVGTSRSEHKEIECFKCGGKGHYAVESNKESPPLRE